MYFRQAYYEPGNHIYVIARLIVCPLIIYGIPGNLSRLPVFQTTGNSFGI